MKIQLLRCFKADQRISMDVVANSMRQSLATHGHEVLDFEPSSGLEKFSANQLVMRYLRYVHYPRQVKKLASVGAEVQHVVDHGYAHLLPTLNSELKIVSAHDLIPLLTWKGKIESLSLDGKVRTSDAGSRKPLLNLYSLKFIKDFDHVVTISQSTADDLQKYLGITAENMTIVPPAISSIFVPRKASDTEAFRKKYQLDPSIKWVMLSGREAYKNHPNAFAAIEQLNSSISDQIGIVRAGLPSTQFDTLVNHYQMQDRARSIFLTHAELPLLYGAVDCLVFPSLYEGFGMPVAEALACGTPVAVSDRGSLPEVVGELANANDPFDIDGLAQSIKRGVYDKDYRRMISENGPLEMQRYAQKRIGQRLGDLYQQLL